MLTLILESDTVLLLSAIIGLFATFAAIARDTGIRRRSQGPAIS